MTSIDPLLGFSLTFRQLVNNLHYLVTEEAPDPEVYLADLESVADDLDTSVYWVEKACDWLDRYGPFPVDENGIPTIRASTAQEQEEDRDDGASD